MDGTVQPAPDFGAKTPSITWSTLPTQSRGKAIEVLSAGRAAVGEMGGGSADDPRFQAENRYA